MSLATRLHLTTIALGLVEEECARATRKHGPMRSHHEAFAVLKEEVDELWADVMRDRHGDASREAIQVAAMAVRMLVDVATWEPCPIDGFKLGPSNKEIEEAAAAAAAEAARGRALDAEQTTHVLEDAVQALTLAADRIADLERRLAALETGAAQAPRHVLDEDAMIAETERVNAEVRSRRSNAARIMAQVKAQRTEQADQISGREFLSSMESREPSTADNILNRIRARIEAKREAEKDPEPVAMDPATFLSDRGVSPELCDQLAAWMQRKDAYAADHGPNGVSRDDRRADIAARAEEIADAIMAETDRARAAEEPFFEAHTYRMSDFVDGMDDGDEEQPVSLDDKVDALVTQVNTELDSLENGLDDVRTTVDEILPVLNAAGLMHDATMLRVDRLEGGFERLLDVQARISEVGDARGTLIENRLDRVEDSLQDLDDKVYSLAGDLKQLIAATVDLAELVKKISQDR